MGREGEVMTAGLRACSLRAGVGNCEGLWRNGEGEERRE